jgi:hypothetical protein
MLNEFENALRVNRREMESRHSQGELRFAGALGTAWYIRFWRAEQAPKYEDRIWKAVLLLHAAIGRLALDHLE